MNKTSYTPAWIPQKRHMTAVMKTGYCAENLVIFYLKSRGWHILARNYETHKGEIDIIATKMGADLKNYPTVAFVEVKSRTTRHCLSPALSVTRLKKQKITAVMRQWIGRNAPLQAVCRCDIASVILPKHQLPTIQYLPNAFCAREEFGW